MGVPKRKTSRSRRDRRSSCKFIRPKVAIKCNNCNNPILPHTVCSSCGYYKGKKILTTKIERLLKRGEKRSKQKKAEINKIKETQGNNEQLNNEQLNKEDNK
jgi:large subunit ribosomal protein L32